MTTPDQHIEQGTPVGELELPEFPPIGIGEPPVIKSGGCELLEGDGARNPGCVATVKCDGPDGQPCGQKFLLDLLSQELIACPKCGLRFTWIFAVAEVDDDDIVYDVLADVFENNGLQVPARGDAADDGQADDDYHSSSSSDEP